MRVCGGAKGRSVVRRSSLIPHGGIIAHLFGGVKGGGGLDRGARVLAGRERGERRERGRGQAIKSCAAQGWNAFLTILTLFCHFSIDRLWYNRSKRSQLYLASARPLPQSLGVNSEGWSHRRCHPSISGGPGLSRWHLFQLMLGLVPGGEEGIPKSKGEKSDEVPNLNHTPLRLSNAARSDSVPGDYGIY